MVLMLFSELAQTLGSAEHPPECQRNLWHQNGFCVFFKHWMGGGGDNDPQNSPNMSKFDSNSVSLFDSTALSLSKIQASIDRT